MDLTGLRRSFHGSYETIAEKMRATIKQELGITVSAGVSLSKVLAKIGSKHNKPDGLTMIPGREIHLYLDKLPVGKVWGIGPNTAAFLNKHGIMTALQFARCDERFIEQNLSKPYREIWHELNGRSVYPVTTEAKNTYQSISKAKTFTPPSRDEAFVFAQVSKNLENACIKARRYKLSATRLVLFLRKQDFTGSGVELQAEPAFRLSRGDVRPAAQRVSGRSTRRTRSTARPAWSCPGSWPRKAGSIRSSRTPRRSRRCPGSTSAWTSCRRSTASTRSSTARACPQSCRPSTKASAATCPMRKDNLFKGENKRQRLGLPVLNIKI